MSTSTGITGGTGGGDPPIPEATTLSDPPTDGITALSYLPPPSAQSSSSLLASTSWDGSVRIHDTKTKCAMLSHVMDSGPLLSLATPPPSPSSSPVGNGVVITGGLDGSIRMLDITSTTSQVIGRHQFDGPNPEKRIACSCLASLNGTEVGSSTSNNNNIIASAGWHKQCHLWDIRQQSSTESGNNNAIASIALPGKAFGMDYDPIHNRIVIVTSGRRTCFIDVRKPTSAQIVLDRESSLKFQTRTVRYFPDGNGIAMGSIEGRVAVEYLDELTNQPTGKKKYAFKCHRVADTVYPVNCIDFNPKFGTFATGGCDGTVVLWDGFNKKKLTSLGKFPTSIAALCFNYDGTELAIASSYTFEEGEREHHPRDEIYIRPVLDSECKPKTSIKQ